MIKSKALEEALCRSFCTSITVRPVPCGYAISTFFSDRSGDRIGCYVVEAGDRLHLEDGGEYLPHLVASGISIERGTRERVLDDILDEGGAFWDRDTYTIRTGEFDADDIGKRTIQFISSLVRARDVELLNVETVRSTFRDDATAALTARFGKVADFEQNTPIHAQFGEFPSDLVLRPKPDGEIEAAAIYFVTSNDKLNEALLLLYEIQSRKCEYFKTCFKIIAMIEDSDMRAISRRHFQRAQNRSLPMPIFRGDEEAAIHCIADILSLPA